MIEFDPAITTTKFSIVKYFEKSLKPSIKVKMNQDAAYLDNYEELVVKVVKTKAKKGLQLSSYIQETN